MMLYPGKSSPPRPDAAVISRSLALDFLSEID
jgi:hypothetical protein